MKSSVVTDNSRSKNNDQAYTNVYKSEICCFLCKMYINTEIQSHLVNEMYSWFLAAIINIYTQQKTMTMLHIQFHSLTDLY